MKSSKKLKEIFVNAADAAKISLILSVKKYDPKFRFSKYQELYSSLSDEGKLYIDKKLPQIKSG
jgi:hypothetical protein